ncbi:Inosine-5'-monophosphate dehydrogenase [Symmachiella macrocystis]|uniref:Inosine-5'-monophosphate dehydrogenase n=1 Tax=Symmachiella macrocystis TaxID=2527985 RepID=A0A5C6BMF2_9PLAN|nr:CBS domain-containing protein [Symmachiella macrocystis]TWU12897.1 Inosine-5'-monophosphate dehydrogenase [Symmachiella macrocystis]
MESPRLAQDIMVEKLVTLNPDQDVFESIKSLLKHKITGAPVVGDNRLYLGMFSEKCCMSVLTLIAHLASERGYPSAAPPTASQFMATKLVTLDPRTDVFDAIAYLLKHHVSGVPVIDADRNFLGVFSEKTSMRVLVDAAYENMPTTEVGAFKNPDRGRTISEQTTLLECAQIFLDTPYRRLCVLKDGKLVGQISRRDVLLNENILTAIVNDRREALIAESRQVDLSEAEEPTEHGPLPSTAVHNFSDRKAHTITADLDLLGIAQVFLTTPYRRLPVLHEGKLIGQISRRDVLLATNNLIQIAPEPVKAMLYLSSISDRQETRFA